MLSHVADYDASQALEWLPDGTGKTVRKSAVRTTLLALALVAADTARVIIVRGKRPEPILATSAYDGAMRKPIPQPDMPLPELFELLRDPKDAEAFLRKHIRGYSPEGIADFCRRFRNQPDLMLKGKEAECNNLAEFWCQLWEATGRKPYMVSMWPTSEKSWQHRNDGIKSKKGWHMIAAYRRKNPTSRAEEFVIGDNQSAVEWAGTLDEYAASIGMSILPIGGVQKYVPAATNDDFRAQIWDLAGVNKQPVLSPEESEQEIPTRNFDVALAK